MKWRFAREKLLEEAVHISANPGGLMGIYCWNGGLEYDANKHVLHLLDVLNIHELIFVTNQSSPLHPTLVYYVLL